MVAGQAGQTADVPPERALVTALVDALVGRDEPHPLAVGGQPGDELQRGVGAARHVAQTERWDQHVELGVGGQLRVDDEAHGIHPRDLAPLRLVLPLPGALGEPVGGVAGAATLGAEVPQGLLAPLDHFGVLAPVPRSVEERTGATAFVGARRDVVDERVLADAGDIGVLGKVERAVEPGIRLQAQEAAEQQVLHQWVEAGGANIGIGRDVPRRVEQAGAGTGPRRPRCARSAPAG